MSDYRVLLDIGAERERQDAKWGIQTHSDGDWAMIFLEELGEAAMEYNDHGDTPHFRKELVEATAVLTQWIEAIDRRVTADKWLR